jgi:leucine dehydrogenase
MAKTKTGTQPASVLASMSAADFEEIIYLQDKKAGLQSIVAIHSTRLGPAHGGIRCVPYRGEADALADVMRLAHAMSRKAALARIPAGGGKAVIIDHPGLKRRAAYETLGRAIQSWGGRFYTGPDVGTRERDLAAVRRHTKYVVEPQKGRGPGDIAVATAKGVIASIRATLRFLYGSESPVGRHVAVQGLGAIGGRVAEWLWSEGAELTVTEVVAAKLRPWSRRARVRIATPQRILATKCDLLCPCALGGIISARTRLGCTAIVGAANNPLTETRVAEALHRRGILFAPDFVVNAGGLIEGAGRHLGFARKTSRMIEDIGETLTAIYKRSRRQDTSPYQVALAMADARLRARQ